MKKKLLLILLALTMMVGSVFVMTACTKTDDSDDTPTGSDSGEEKIVLTENTDFSALVSEKVTEEGWKAAFDEALYNNCTIKVKDFDGEFAGSFEKSGGISKAYMPHEGNTTMWYRYKDDVLTACMDEGELFKIEMHKGDEYFEEFMEQYRQFGTYRVACPDFGKYYSSFVFDETKGRYVYDGDGITTNVVLEIGDTTYTHVEIVMINGLIAYAEYYEKQGGGPDGAYGYNARSYFYNFGSTAAVSIPEE